MAQAPPALWVWASTSCFLLHFPLFFFLSWVIHVSTIFFISRHFKVEISKRKDYSEHPRPLHLHASIVNIFLIVDFSHIFSLFLCKYTFLLLNHFKIRCRHHKTLKYFLNCPQNVYSFLLWLFIQDPIRNHTWHLLSFSLVINGLEFSC